MNWVSTIGDVSWEDEQITYQPIPIPASDLLKGGGHLGGQIQSDILFGNGTIEFEVSLSDPVSICEMIIGAEDASAIYVGLGGETPYVIRQWRGSEWKDLATAGWANKLKVNEWCKLKITVNGSNVELFVSEVRVCSASTLIKRAPLGMWLHSKERILVRNIVVTPNRPRAFVVMQFTEEFDALYRDVIRPTLDKYGYQAVRADDMYNCGMILEDITKSIQESTIVIADITPDNPNVYYEVGFSHGQQKVTILLCDKKRDRLPFDMSGFRVVFYDNSIGGKRLVEERLSKHLQAINPGLSLT